MALVIRSNNKTLVVDHLAVADPFGVEPAARGLHPSTSQLSLSRVEHKQTLYTP